MACAQSPEDAVGREAGKKGGEERGWKVLLLLPTGGE